MNIEIKLPKKYTEEVALRSIDLTIELIKKYNREDITITGCHPFNDLVRNKSKSMIWMNGKEVTHIILGCILGLLPFMSLKYDVFEPPIYSKEKEVFDNFYAKSKLELIAIWMKHRFV